MILGCIGDDFTGSSDLANALAKAGMATVQYSGVPSFESGADVEAGVVALKSRTIPAADAVAQSLHALEWLRAQGCRQFYFKYCSTFDSTVEGNIGPVAEALGDALGAKVIPFCPAFPATGRTVYRGHLFVGDRLLSESGMQDHPLTPMRDPDLRRVLARQSASRVGYVPDPVVASGPVAIETALREQERIGNRFVVVDAINDMDLMALGAASAKLVLVTGGSGAAIGLPANFDSPASRSSTYKWRGVNGPAAALAGSVSQTTRRQVERHKAAGRPALELRAEDAVEGSVTPANLADWLLAQSDTPLIYSSADPATIARVQKRYGKAQTSGAIEWLLSEIAALAVSRGVRRLVCAGGETSGAIVTRLRIAALEVGPEIDPGIPALRASCNGLGLALKSGNFGCDDFFAKAASMLETGS